MFGRRFSSGTSTSSMTIWPVVEALKENFPSILGAESPFIPFSKQITESNMTDLILLADAILILTTARLVQLKQQWVSKQEVVVYTRNLAMKNGSHHE